MAVRCEELQSSFKETVLRFQASGFSLPLMVPRSTEEGSHPVGAENTHQFLCARIATKDLHSMHSKHPLRRIVGISFFGHSQICVRKRWLVIHTIIIVIVVTSFLLRRCVGARTLCFCTLLGRLRVFLFMPRIGAFLGLKGGMS